ncbi:hypothetical protein [Membranihabitans marinus]|uniref:hypothetical protein n=1 Tax=Membranihabitans marinus TaxID=1227546 RepID=UPI001F45E102|nr:hypothetical protein [Membranihabitans marinus]
MNIYRCKPLVVGVLIIWATGLWAQSGNENIFIKTFKRTTELQLSAINDGGDISVRGWEKDSIRVVVKTRLKSNSEEEQDMDWIKPSINQSKSQIVVNVEMEKPSQSFLSEWISKNIYDTNKSDVWIGYEIFMPKNMDLQITSGFGKVVVEQWHGKLRIEQEHGSLRIDGSINELSGALKFVKASLDQLNQLDADLKQAELKVQHVDIMSIRSTGGQLDIGSVDVLDMVSGRDDVLINHLGAASIDANFSHFDFQTVSGRQDIKLLFGSLNIKGFKSTIPVMKIDQRSSDVSIYVGDKSFEFKAAIDGGVLRLPINTKVLSSTNVDKSGKEKNIHALYGQGKTNIIQLYSKNGSVIFKH